MTQAEGRLIVSATLPARWSFGNWLAGSGGPVVDGWIRGKFTRFVITETPEGYRQRQVGPGPL